MKLIKTPKVSTASIRGQLLRDVIIPLGSRLITLERMNALQYKLWRVPENYINIPLELPNCRAEMLSHKTSPINYVFLQLHGGAYTRPFYDAYRRNAQHLVDNFPGSAVLSLDYRIAPQNPFPAALNDALDAYKYLLSEGYTSKQIILIGDSAGGGLSLALIEYLRDHAMPQPASVVAMSPWTNLACNFPSFTNNALYDKMLGNSTDMLVNNPYAGGNPKNPYISPYYGKLNDLCPILIQVGSYERLIDDSLLFSDKAKKANVDVRCTVYPKMFHVFQLFYSLPESKVAWAEIKLFLNMKLEVINNE